MYKYVWAQSGIIAFNWTKAMNFMHFVQKIEYHYEILFWICLQAICTHVIRVGG